MRVVPNIFHRSSQIDAAEQRQPYWGIVAIESVVLNCEIHRIRPSLYSKGCSKPLVSKATCWISEFIANLDSKVTGCSFWSFENCTPGSTIEEWDPPRYRHRRRSQGHRDWPRGRRLRWSQLKCCVKVWIPMSEWSFFVWFHPYS